MQHSHIKQHPHYDDTEEYRDTGGTVCDVWDIDASKAIFAVEAIQLMYVGYGARIVFRRIPPS
jgi:hypothetical protein